MPRTAQSKVGGVVAFFRAASLEIMDVAFDLVRDVVQERRGKSAKAKARASKGEVATPVEVPTPRKRRGPARGRVKRTYTRRATPTDVPLPLGEMHNTAGQPTLVAP